MKKIIKNVVTIVTIIAGVVAILSFIYQVKSDNPKLEILEISNDNLTNLPKVENLKSNFFYKDSVIDNLWKLNASIKNTNSKTIIGKGTNKNIIENNLNFKLNDGFKLIDFNITSSDFPNKISKIENEVNFSFNQWRKDEKIDVTIYAEQISEQKSELKLLINERDIIDGVVEYRKINQTVEKTAKLIDYLPLPLRNILFWIGVIFYGLFLLFLPIGMLLEISKYYNYSKWKRIWLNSFNEKIANLYNEGIIQKHLNPQDVTLKIWDEINIPKPDIPTNSLSSMIIAIVFGVCLFAIPILWMIEI